MYSSLRPSGNVTNFVPYLSNWASFVGAASQRQQIEHGQHTAQQRLDSPHPDCVQPSHRRRYDAGSGLLNIGSFEVEDDDDLRWSAGDAMASKDSKKLRRRFA